MNANSVAREITNAPAARGDAFRRLMVSQAFAAAPPPLFGVTTDIALIMHISQGADDTCVSFFRPCASGADEWRTTALSDFQNREI